MRSPIALFAFLAVIACAYAEETVSVDDRELPRFPANSPEAALKTFQVRKGFHVELVASEYGKWNTAMTEKITGELLVRFSGRGGIDSCDYCATA